MNGRQGLRDLNFGSAGPLFYNSVLKLFKYRHGGRSRPGAAAPELSGLFRAAGALRFRLVEVLRFRTAGPGPAGWFL